MANFFSSAPLNYGADIIARTYQNATNNITGAIGQASSQYADQQRLKQQAAIEEQRRQMELERQLKSGLSEYNVAPVVDQSGKFDPYGSAAALKKAKDMDDRVRAMTSMRDRGDFQTQSDATDLGIKQPDQSSGAVGSFDMSGGGTGQMPGAPGEDLGRQVFLEKQRVQNAEYDKQRKTSADAELVRQRSANDAKELDAFRSAFAREPAGAELDPSGRLSAGALGALQAARVNSIKGFASDPSKPGALIPIPGGPADIKAKADEEKARALKDAVTAKEQSLANSRSNVLSNIDAALPQVGATTAGVIGGRLSGFYQPAQDLHANLDAIKSGLGVDTLNEMRASSANGGTGIGRIMQVEFDAFSKAARNLDQHQSPEQLRANLEAIKTHLTNWQAAHEAVTGGQTAAPVKQPGAPLPTGWSITK